MVILTFTCKHYYLSSVERGTLDISDWDMKMALERLDINRSFDEKEVMNRVSNVLKKLDEKRWAEKDGLWNLHDLFCVIQGYF